MEMRLVCLLSYERHCIPCLPCSAYCKNSIDGQWYCFDDSEVSPVADEDVCQQTAYILFYQRRTAIPSWSANSSVAGWDLAFSKKCCSIAGDGRLLPCLITYCLPSCRFYQFVLVRSLDQPAAWQSACQLGLRSLVQTNLAGVAGRVCGVPT